MHGHRAARGEAEQLKGRVAHAEARIQELEAANAQLRAQLGLAPEPGPPATPALPWTEEEARPGEVPHRDDLGQGEGAADAQVIGSGGVVIQELEAVSPVVEQPQAPAEPEHGVTAQDEGAKLRQGLADID